MPKSLKIAVTILLALTPLAASAVRASELQPITPRDCTTVRRIPDDPISSPIQINPQHTLVAYLVNSPNLVTNQNDVELYVRNLRKSDRGESVLILTGIEIHDLHWLGDGTHLTALVRYEGHLVVTLIDINKKAQTIIANAENTDIKEYSIDRAGKTLVFATDVGRSPISTEYSHENAEQGYLIRPNAPADTRYHQAHLFMVAKVGRGSWAKPIELAISSPFTHAPIQALSYLIMLHLSISPDGTSLLFSFVEREHLPRSWANYPLVKSSNLDGVPLELTALYDLNTHETALSFASSFVYETPMWAADSSSYIGVTTEAVNDPRAGYGTDNVHYLPPPHVYKVSRISAIAEEVMAASPIAPHILSADLNGDILLRSGTTKIVRIRHEDGKWRKQSVVDIPLPTQRSLNYGPLASDGEHVVGDYEDASTPPEIYGYDIGQPSIQVLAKLNPQFEHLRIAPTETFSWQTSDGFKIQGTLWLPPNYTERMKYPLVIQTKPDAGDFACDSGGNHDPSFAPQPIADAGIIYIARTWPQDYQYADDAAHYPKGYPGGISEAAFHMDIWDSAVKALVQKGMIDPNRVGIIGFSRAGWYTEFILAHSKIRYRAATAADNVLYSMGDYWLHQNERSVLDGEILYGGPPYGPTLDNWRNYSISFNVDKIHTPLLMEVFGEGVEYIPGKSLPDVLAPSFEIMTAMAHFAKPAALYYYPNDVHQPNHPQTRLASLQRNLDWYRFWLQEYERSDPKTVVQYLEWRTLKDSQKHSVNQLQEEP